MNFAKFEKTPSVAASIKISPPPIAKTHRRSNLLQMYYEKILHKKFCKIHMDTSMLDYFLVTLQARYATL